MRHVEALDGRTAAEGHHVDRRGDVDAAAADDWTVDQESRGVARSFLLSLTFSIGLTIMFAILFFATWAASSVLKASWWTYVAAGVCLLMGLHLLGLVQFHIPAPAGVQPRQRGFVGALLAVPTAVACAAGEACVGAER